MPHVSHSRRQHAVGEGSFHSGAVGSNDRQLRYVYDCGAQPKYRAALHDRIDDLHRELARAGDPHIDLLFLSHAHIDHVNGTAQLITQADVETVVMPLLTSAERLLAFAHAEAVSGVPPLDRAFYGSFVADPVAALSALGVSRVIQVTPGEDDGLLPPGTIDPEGPDGRPVVQLPPDAEGDVEPPRGWDVVGNGSIRGGQYAGASSLTMPDTLYFQVAGLPEDLPWVLVTQVDSGVKGQLDDFRIALRKRLRTKGIDLTDVESDPDLMLHVVTHERTLLADAYSNAVNKNLNITSLSLYSGLEAPHPGTPAVAWTHQLWHRDADGTGPTPLLLHGPSPDTRKIGWLGTGDALLKQKGRRSRFLTHFELYAEQVHTVVLPHHGSSHNFDRELLDELSPRLCVAPADDYSNWRHPGDDVVGAVVKSLALPMRVTADPHSGLSEWFEVNV